MSMEGGKGESPKNRPFYKETLQALDVAEHEATRVLGRLNGLLRISTSPDLEILEVYWILGFNIVQMCKSLGNLNYGLLNLVSRQVGQKKLMEELQVRINQTNQFIPAFAQAASLMNAQTLNKLSSREEISESQKNELKLLSIKMDTNLDVLMRLASYRNTDTDSDL